MDPQHPTDDLAMLEHEAEGADACWQPVFDFTTTAKRKSVSDDDWHMVDSSAKSDTGSTSRSAAGEAPSGPSDMHVEVAPMQGSTEGRHSRSSLQSEQMADSLLSAPLDEAVMAAALTVPLPDMQQQLDAGAGAGVPLDGSSIDELDSCAVAALVRQVSGEGSLDGFADEHDAQQVEGQLHEMAAGEELAAAAQPESPELATAEVATAPVPLTPTPARAGAVRRLADLATRLFEDAAHAVGGAGGALGRQLRLVRGWMMEGAALLVGHLHRGGVELRELVTDRIPAFLNSLGAKLGLELPAKPLKLGSRSTLAVVGAALAAASAATLYYYSRSKALEAQVMEKNRELAKVVMRMLSLQQSMSSHHAMHGAILAHTRHTAMVGFPHQML